MKLNFIAFASAATLVVALGACTNGGYDSADSSAAPETAAAPVEAPAATAASRDTAKMVVQANFLENGAVKRPNDWRSWVFVGSPLTPNELNGGAAGFPEFHNVYVEPSALDYFETNGTWAEGTQIVKELALVRDNNNNPENGSTAEVSGVGYQQGEFSGLELLYKDSARFPDAVGGWAFFSFGHQPQPYETSGEALPNEACSACHQASADTDLVFTQFYPLLRAAAAN